jgi:murein DD-endopeptidase MepM/ murein hydrolase activator NlpD
MPPIANAKDSARALESILLKQLLQESKVLQGSSQAGSGIYASMFCEALADAVAQGGGLGIAKLLEGSFVDGEEGSDEITAHNLKNGYLFNSKKTDEEGSSMSGITSDYGKRIDPIHGQVRFHAGIDIAAQEGSAILALSSGIVERAGPRGAYGNAVEINTGQGTSMVYGHAKNLAVEEGDRVEKGQVIATVGQTGRATGPHLHFEVRKEGKTINPEIALNRMGERADVLIDRKAQNFGNGEKP